ncbi:MAG: FHA domain-containing protein [Clostridiales bacterium]|nr:FHA domain-containing protein [Clostridiales bacterium]
MKVSYRREIKQNYMIIDPEEMEWDGYESRMMESNSVSGLLRFSLRCTEDGMRFYYEITSKQPLNRLLEGRSIRAPQLRSLMIGIASALEHMDRFLLREQCVLLEPEYIYVEPDSFRIWLCFVPGLERDFPEMLGKLLEYLLGSVDHRDQESVTIAYGMYQETRQENYGLEDVMRCLLGEERREERQAVVEARKTVVEARQTVTEARELISPGTDKRIVERVERETNGRKPVQSERSVSERQKINREAAQRKKQGDSREPLTQEPRQSLRKRWTEWWRRKRKRKKEEDLPLQPTWEMMFYDEEDAENGYAENGYAEEKNEGRGCFGERGEEDRENRRNRSEKRLAVKEVAPEAEADGGTVLLTDLAAVSGPRLLRAMDYGEEDIPIPYYPFVIGKQENLVDYCLKHETVSRLHLRIDRREEDYYVEDLNSTNGTMLQGRLLENNETAKLHSGDELRIAGCRYRFE